MIGAAILVIPHMAVLVMSKSVGARLCLFIMLIIDVLLNIIGYAIFVVSCLMWAGWYATQAQERSMAPYTNAGRYTSPTDYNDKLILRLNVMAGWSAGIAYWAMGLFIFVLAIECLVLSVYYKFYTTGRDSIKN